MIKVVLLVILVHNTSTGDLLFRASEIFRPSIVTANLIEECRVTGIARAKSLTKKYRTMFPFASTNVDCEWIPDPGEPA